MTSCVYLEEMFLKQAAYGQRVLWSIAVSEYLYSPLVSSIGSIMPISAIYIDTSGRISSIVGILSNLYGFA